MQLSELTDLFDQSCRRYHLVGTETAGVVAGLDLAGRLFTVLHGEVLNRVNPEAFSGQSTRKGFLNPGGDGLWPAPEGTTLGYEYSTGAWRVPPGLTGARYVLTSKSDHRAVIQAEIDLINNQGLGIPTLFERDITVHAEENTVVVTTTESITYLGSQELSREKCLLAPWSLCQFDSGPGCRVVFPAVAPDAIWDLYEASDNQRTQANGLWETRTDGAMRYQIGLNASVEWIEYQDPRCGLTVKRSAAPLGTGFSHIDIADTPPTTPPSDQGVSLSVYSDPSGFMEIEAAGGCAASLQPGGRSSVTIATRYSRRAT